MWQRFSPWLLIVSAVVTLVDLGFSPRSLQAALAVHRTVLADPDGWALICGPLGDRPQARFAAASRSSRDTRLPDDSAILADAHGTSIPRTSVRLAASRVQPDPAPFSRGPVSRAPPGLSAPPL